MTGNFLRIGLQSKFPLFHRSIAISVGGGPYFTGDQAMIIGERLRELRKQKNFTQGEVESRTGLLRCYISRVEHGHTVPSVVTLEKFARALEVPIYQLFYDGENPPPANLAKRKTGNEAEWGNKGKDARLLAKFRQLFSRMDKRDLRLVIVTAQKMAKRKVD
jgi:transcriptional regulator with XRE-family HTH domain